MRGEIGLFLGAAIIAVGCGGMSDRAGTAAAGRAGSGGSGMPAGGMGAGGGLVTGGTSATGGSVSGNGGVSGSGGVAGSNKVVYRAVVTNGIDCCDYVTVTRADPASSTCVFFEVAVMGPDSVEVGKASAFPGSDHCCPNDPLFAAFCATGTGCPVSTASTGTAALDGAGFDIDLTLTFEPTMWLPASIEFRVQDLSTASCRAPPVLPACLQPIDPGPCDGAIQRFAFDPEAAACVPFTYGGCQGNDNRFDTPGACEVACVAALRPECLPGSGRSEGCPCTSHDQCSGVCSSALYEEGGTCAPSSVGYCTYIDEGTCACTVDTGERRCGV